jgi:hypothetical protein
MTFDHRTTRIHVADLDREIEQLRTERQIGAGSAQTSVVERARPGVGRALMSAGGALAGGEGSLRTHRA